MVAKNGRSIAEAWKALRKSLLSSKEEGHDGIRKEGKASSPEISKERIRNSNLEGGTYVDIKIFA